MPNPFAIDEETAAAQAALAARIYEIVSKIITAVSCPKCHATVGTPCVSSNVRTPPGDIHKARQLMFYNPSLLKSKSAQKKYL